MVAIAAVVSAVAPVPGLAPAAAAEQRAVLLPMDERAMRAAGIQTLRVQREAGSSDLTFPGTVAIPPQQVQVVAAPVRGLVEQIRVATDELVTAGQPLALLRSPDLIEAQRLFLTALSDEALAADRLRRARALFEGRAAPERDVRVAETEAQNARAKLDEQHQVLSLIGMREADIAELRQSRRLIPALTLYAPIDGTVTQRHASAGERVENAAPVFTIADLSPLWVRIQVPAARLPLVLVGAEVTLPALGASGRVIRISRTVDPQTQSGGAIAEISTNGGSVRPGLAVGVNVRVEQNGVAQWLVPPGSVVRHRERSWVFVRVPEGFAARPVQVVSESSRGVSIRADLDGTTEVATRGILPLLAELAEADQD